MSKTLAEQLVKCLPEGWKAFAAGDGSFVYVDGYEEGECIWTNGKGESPWFINWALDELFFKTEYVELCGDIHTDWTVKASRILDGNRWTTSVLNKPTKTLALAYALVEVCGER